MVLGVTKITVGKNQQIKSLKEALEKLYENGTIILEPGVYKEHVNFDKKVKIVGATDSIMNKSSSDLPIVVLDSTKSCEISAPVEIEGVVFTHEKKLSFNNLQNYAEEKYNFDKDIKSKDYGDVDFASCLLVNSDAKLKNVAVLDSLTHGITLAKTKGTIEDSIISHCCYNCLYCVEKTEATVQETKIINSLYYGVIAKENSNPSLKDCEIYGNLSIGIAVIGQARGTYTNCHIHDNQNNGLIIGGSSTPSFEDCKIHDNKKEGEYYPGVVVKESSNPSLKDCEIYGHLSTGIIVTDQAKGTYTNCHIHDNLVGVHVHGSSNPSIKDCEIYGHLTLGIIVTDQARGTYTNCYIHDNQSNGLNIGGSSSPSFEDCKIHNNKKEGEYYPAVVVKGSSNPSIKACEIYGHLGNGIWVKDQAKGTYKNCYLHNNKKTNFSIETSNTIDTSTCRME